MKKNIEYNKDNKINTNKINNERIEEFDIRIEIRLLTPKVSLIQFEY